MPCVPRLLAVEKYTICYSFSAVKKREPLENNLREKGVVRGSQ
jgi:hypothetical protein